jgi:hypothetical protein
MKAIEILTDRINRNLAMYKVGNVFRWQGGTSVGSFGIPLHSSLFKHPV